MRRPSQGLIQPRHQAAYALAALGVGLAFIVAAGPTRGAWIATVSLVSVVTLVLAVVDVLEPSGVGLAIALVLSTAPVATSETRALLLVGITLSALSFLGYHLWRSPRRRLGIRRTVVAVAIGVIGLIPLVTEGSTASAGVALIATIGAGAFLYRVPAELFLKAGMAVFCCCLLPVALEWGETARTVGLSAFLALLVGTLFALDESAPSVAER